LLTTLKLPALYVQQNVTILFRQNQDKKEIFTILLCLTVPSKPPPKVTAHNTSSTSILVQWKPIPDQFIHGILKGYIINYHVAAKSSFNNWKNVTSEGLSTLKEIEGLEKYTEYVVQVSGYTVKGEGRVSKAANVWTDEDGKI